MELDKEILKTLAFYDVFEFPLTGFEIHKNLGAKAGFGETHQVLDNLKNNFLIKEKDGYFFLPQNDYSAKRRTRFLVSFKKLQKAKRVAWVLSYFPFVRFIGLCNSMGYFNAKENSDIDFFIITRKGHIWTARFFAVLFLKIFNLRPNLESNKDKICLSFIISEDKMDISDVALPGGDPYFHRWFSWIMPLYGEKFWKKFVVANSWVKNYLPNFLEQSGLIVKNFSLVKMIFEKLFLGPHWESLFRKIQKHFLPENLKEAASLRTDKSVVINNKMLKFHLVDRRNEYKDKYLQKIEDLDSKFRILDSE